jgi:hypothetical protein
MAAIKRISKSAAQQQKSIGNPPTIREKTGAIPLQQTQPAQTVPASPNTPDHDPVDRPSHYTQGDIECLDAIKASMPHEQFLGFLKGSEMKYVWRYQHKGGLEDLRKATFYLARLISEVSV